MGKVKAFLVKGYCELRNEGKIYFYGQTNAVSIKQAHYYICMEIQKLFNTREWLEPVIVDWTNFTSSQYLQRETSPKKVIYYRVKDNKKEILFGVDR